MDLFSPIINLVTTSVDKIFPDADSEQKKKLSALQNTLQAQLSTLTAELHGNKLQRSWRPTLMWLFIIILFNNFLFVPYARCFGLPLPTLDFPDWFQHLLVVGVGGYTGGRTVEKCVKLVKGG